jgi:uncharacterized protein with HEPN domain
MKPPDMVILSKIQTDAQDILEFIQGHDLDSLIANKVLKKAVVMSIEVIAKPEVLQLALV